MRPVFAFPFLVRLRDHGAWPGISQYSISHVAFFISHFYLASRIFISHLAFLSRMSHFYLTFLSHISHFYLASRIFISHLTFFISHLAFLSRMSHFYLAFLSRILHFISHLAFLSRILHFYLASRIFYLASRISHLTPDFFFSSFIKSHLECPLQASVQLFRKKENKRAKGLSDEIQCKFQFAF